MEIFSRLCYNHRQINFLRPAAAKSGSNREGKEAQHVIDHQNENLQPNENEQDTTMIYFNPELMQSIANVTARKRESFREMQAAAEDGDLDAEYRLALSYANGEDGAPEDEEKAFYWFSKAADGDHIGAQFNLGLCYARGEGTEKDYDKAVKLFALTAEQGYPPAQCELGLCYELGHGVEMDKQRAAELYRESAEQGFAPAQCNLGFFYFHGIGVEENHVWRTTRKPPCGLPSPPSRDTQERRY